MRIDDSENQVKCWLDYPDEIQQLETAARKQDWEQEIAVQLMARIGCRASGVLTAKPQNLMWNSKGEYWQIEILGKNTKGGSKATRDAYVPTKVKENLDRYASEREIKENDPYVDASVSTVRRWVRQLTDSIADDRGDRWTHVSSHDLRRSWATYHLVEQDVPVRVMMSIGGWSSYDAIEPYLAAPTPSKIGAEMG